MSRYRSARIPAATGASVRITEAVDDFLLFHQRRAHSLSYLCELRSYLIGGSDYYGKRRVWLPFVPWTVAHNVTTLHGLTKERTGAYLEHVRALASYGDYAKVCAILKRLFRFLVRDGILNEEPLHIEHPKRLKTEIKVFTPDEIERMRQVIAKENVRDQAIFMLLLDTGLRAAELCNLRLDDVRWERQELVVRAEVSKNRSFRIIPISGSIKTLRKYRLLRGDSTESCDRLFLGFYHTPVVAKNGKRRNIDKIVFCNSGLTRIGLYALVRKWGKLANISEARCSPHTLRHFFASQFIKHGGSIVALQRIMGHSRMDVTARYLSFSMADVRAEHERFSPAVAVDRRSKR